MHDTMKDRLKRTGQQPGPTALREEVFRDDPDGRHAYELSADRAALGAKLKVRRRRAAVTIEQLAEIIESSPDHVADLESATGPWPSLSDVRVYLRGCRRAGDRPTKNTHRRQGHSKRTA